MKNERSGIAVSLRLTGFDRALVEEVPAKEREEVRVGRGSDIRKLWRRTCQI